MPNETVKPAAVTPDPRDVRIAELEKEVEALSNDLKKVDEAHTQAVDNLEKKLKSAKSAPQGDCVFLGGKTFAIERTVLASQASDDARKGFLDADAELIVVKRG